MTDVAEIAALGIDRQRAFCRRSEARDEPEQRRLARSVRPSDEQEPRARHAERDPSEGPLAAVPLLQTVPDDHHARASPLPDGRTVAEIIYTVVARTTKAKKTTLITPLTVKNAASSRRRSPGRTSVCS